MFQLQSCIPGASENGLQLISTCTAPPKPVPKPTVCSKPAIFRAAPRRGTDGRRYRGMNACPAYIQGQVHHARHVIRWPVTHNPEV